jgi:ABC-type cobalamin/Fe3+-siderophores transport system ATPase subunit
MMAGVNGAGKTTSIGKLAKYYQLQGKSVLLAAGDTFRAAAREQLMAWGERNNVTVIAQQGGDAAAVCYDAIQAATARGIDIVLADTAGRLPTQLHLMEEIKKVKRVIQKALPDAPHEVILVLDANIGQNAISQVKVFDDALGLTGLILTKLDGTAKGGVIAAIAKQRRFRYGLSAWEKALTICARSTARITSTPCSTDYLPHLSTRQAAVGDVTGSRGIQRMIQFDQVTKRYPGGNEALKNLSFTIDTGEMVFLAGHSGAGKSTLLKLVAGIERATSGSVIVSGHNLSKLRNSQIPYVRQHIGMVFQDHKLLFDRSVFDNVMLPLDIIGFDRRDAARRCVPHWTRWACCPRKNPCPSACPVVNSSAVHCPRRRPSSQPAAGG